MASRPSAADALDRANLSRAALAWAGDGDPSQAPPELVAVLGDARFRLPEPATTVALSPDGKTVAAASGSNVLLFDAADGAYRRTLLGHTRELRRLAFSPDGDLLASSSLDGTVKLWKVADGREVRTLGGHKEAWAIAFSPDGKRLAVGTGDGAVFLWGVTEGRLIFQRSCQAKLVFGVAFSPDGKMLAAGADRVVRVWDVDTGAFADICAL